MNNAEDGHRIGGLDMPVDNDIRGHNADTNTWPERGMWRTAIGMIGKALVKPSEKSPVFDDGRLTRLDIEVVENGSRIRVGGSGDDDARHYVFMAAKRASLRASCSSMVITSPRATSVRASST